MTQIKAAVIRIEGRAGQSVPLIVNGRAVDVPLNKDVPLAGPYVEALQNSRHVFTTVRDLNRGEDALGATGDDAEGRQGEQQPGADNLLHQEPVAPVIVASGGPVDQTPGADNLTQTAPDSETATAEARETSEQAAAAAAEGTIEPAVVLTNRDPQAGTAPDAEQPGAGQPSDSTGIAGGSLNKEPFDPATTLKQPIAKITEDMDEFSAEQLSALLKAEKAGGKRSTLIAAIERKQAAAAAA